MNRLLMSIGARLVAPVLFLAVVLGAGVMPSSVRAADVDYTYRFEALSMWESWGRIAGALYVGDKYERYGGGEWWETASELRYSFIEHDDWTQQWHSKALPSPYLYPGWENNKTVRLEIPFTLHKALGMSFGAWNPSEAKGNSEYMPLPGDGLTFTLQGPGVSWTGIVDGKSGAESLSAVWAYLERGDYVLTMSGMIGGFGTGSLDGLDFRGQYASFDVRFNDVPLPGALVLFGTALAGAGAIGRRRQRRAAVPVSVHSADRGQGRI